jgi:hypothetical protein
MPTTRDLQFYRLPALPQLVNTLGANVINVPTDAKILTGWIMSGGSGGGSGRRGALLTIRAGGGGGPGGGCMPFIIDATLLGPTITAVVGAGGTGGAAPTLDDTNGNPGNPGEASYITNLIRTLPAQGAPSVLTPPATGGKGGLNSVGAAQGGMPSAFTVQTGSAGSSTSAQASSNLAASTAPSGPGGGAVDATNVQSAGGDAYQWCAVPVNNTLTPYAKANGGGTGGVNGADGAAVILNGPLIWPLYGNPGAGGGGNNGGGGGRGGDASGYGAGGGGAGGGLNGTTGGRGGNGSQGCIVLAWMF